jgi:hypothetical protein
VFCSSPTPMSAELISRADMITAVNTLSRPVLPPLTLHKSYIASTEIWAKSPFRLPPLKLASSFRHLTAYGITDYMLQVLESMGHVTMAIDHFLQGMPGCLTLGAIIRTRTAVQKHVMLLPTAEELKITTGPESNIYECCRLTAIIFSIAVLFPIPNTYDVLQTLVKRRLGND